VRFAGVEESLFLFSATSVLPSLFPPPLSSSSFLLLFPPPLSSASFLLLFPPPLSSAKLSDLCASALYFSFLLIADT